MYTLGTDTELYNRLVPWGIRSSREYKKRTVRACTYNHFAVLQISLRGDRNAETSRSNSILMNMVNELDGLRAQIHEAQTVY